MVSLAQVAIYGIAGFVVGNATTNGNTKGLNLGWNPWWGVLLGARRRRRCRRSLFGALASRSVGIYFLMITLTYSVIANLIFGQVTDVSGFGGISGIPAPHADRQRRAHTRTASTTSRSSWRSSSTSCSATSRGRRSG